MQVQLPDSTLAALRQHQARTGWIDEVTSSQDAFLLFGGMGPCLYITSAGTFLSGPDLDETFLFREAEDDEAVSALVIGAKRTGIEALLDLVPAAPPGAHLCDFCQGKRWDPLRDTTGEWPIVVCRQCAGRGWID
jgi:hypothetical protein